MGAKGIGHGRVASTALECAPNAPRGAVLLEASAGRARLALRALPGAPLPNVGLVLLGWLASCLHPYAAPCACRFWAGPGTPLDMRSTLGCALGHSNTLYLTFAGGCITMRAYRGVDDMGMRDSVEVVGDKYNPDIGEFTVLPQDPVPIDLVGGRWEKSGGRRIGPPNGEDI